MTEKRNKATALKYDQKKNSAPMVTAKGKGLVADEIIKKAKENEVPILEDASLVELLAELNINETIPEELYQAVAEVFSFIYHADKQMKLGD
ncbi:EscU/YscU/HrcU family type III secretion system export apparatus switch protein [Oceanobacillus sp. CF4.6]|uniref:EscU/YscU/HrcU family type III secretion system export apparatus switch protein n=1 Tax=Oceanobacillus sp. CF4.6 TaxID=3373080 RepID=UPI003EE5DE60